MVDRWLGSAKTGLKCNIFVSQFVSDTRVKEIEKFGAKVFKLKVIMKIP